MQLYRATLLHTRTTKSREKIAGVTSVWCTKPWNTWPNCTVHYHKFKQPSHGLWSSAGL